MSPPSGPYQSRLLNFVAGRSRRLVDQCGRALRNLKVATVWGAQILLYPAYLLFQAGRLFGRQLQQEIKQTLLELRAASEPEDQGPPTVDTPIQRVLQAVQEFWPASFAYTIQTSSSTPLLLAKQPVRELAGAPTDSRLLAIAPGSLAPVAVPGDLSLVHTTAQLQETSADEVGLGQILIRGIASLVGTRTLALVTTQNQILDILTPDQQKRLLQRIIWEVADYQHYLRLSHSVQKPFTSRLPPPLDRTNLLLPVRLFRLLMAWVQRGPVALTINLFQESSLVQVAPEPALLALPGEGAPLFDLPGAWGISHNGATKLASPPTPWLSDLVSQMAHKRSKSRPLARGNQRKLLPPARFLQQFVIWAQNQSAVLLSSLLKDSGSSQPAQTGASAQSPTPTASVVEERSPQPTTLTQLNLSQPRRIQVSPTQIQALTHPDEEPWLTLDDLFGAPLGLPLPTLTSSSTADQELIPPLSLPPSSRIGTIPEDGGKRAVPFNLQPQPDLQNRFSDASQAYYAPTRHTPKDGHLQGWIDPTLETVTAIPVVQSPSHSATGASTPAPIDLQSQTPDELTSSWIDIKAESVGYVKHPLERLIGWLDRAILWLEELGLAIVTWFKRLWK